MAPFDNPYSSKLVTKLSPLIEGQVPDFVQSDHEVFVRFLKHYYQFLEAGELGVTVDINNLLKLRKKLNKWMFKDKLFGHLLNSGLPKGFN